MDLERYNFEDVEVREVFRLAGVGVVRVKRKWRVVNLNDTF